MCDFGHWVKAGEKRALAFLLELQHLGQVRGRYGVIVVIVSMESADAWHLRFDAMMEDREVEPCGAV